jgi:hypothetical protein
MQLIHPRGEEALAALRAMRTVTGGDGAVPPAARAMMAAAARLLMAIESEIDIDGLRPITPEALARAITTPGLGEQLAQAMIVGAIADGEPEPAAYARLEAFARALDVEPPALRTLKLLVEQHTLLFRLDFMRRSHITDMFKDTYRHHGGILGVAAAVLGQRGLYEDKELAARFEALGRLPADTLGHAYFTHCRSQGFAFPGERRGFPLTGVYHDLTHVLAGYDSSPEGELQVGAFTAGFKRTNPFYLLLFVGFLWGSGINLTPVEQPHITGMMARGGMAEGFIRAIERGGRVNTDLSDNWDFWPLLPLPLAEARAQLNVTA